MRTTGELPRSNGGGAKPDAGGRPTQARQIALLFCISLGFITYIDRACMGQAKGSIVDALGLNDREWGWLNTAFVVPYAFLEVPGGWLGDRYGPRGMLIKVVAVWSAFTAMTGAAWNYTSMVVCRILFGAGEAGCYPNITKVFTIWLPSEERVRAQGILWLASRWGGAFTPPAVALIIVAVGWRWMFSIFGLAGVVWAVLFIFWFRDRPADHPAVNAAELALLDGATRNAPSRDKVPLGRLFSSPTAWLLMFQYFCMGNCFFFFLFWLPDYLQKARHLPFQQGANFAALPLFMGGLGCLAGGWFAHLLAKAGMNLGRARRLVCVGGYTGASLLMLASMRIDDPKLAMAAMGMAGFCNDLVMPNAWAACMDVGGRMAGSLSGAMNMVGNGGGAFVPLICGYVLDHSKITPDAPATLHAWNICLMMVAGAWLVGALTWLFIDPVTPIEEAGGEA